MTIPFSPLGEIDPTPRPRVRVQVGGAEHLPLACLIDTGSLRTRLPAWLAEAAGIDLRHGISESIAVAGSGRITARAAHVELTVCEIGLTIPCPVWFCEPWDHAFGLLGQEDFLRSFRLTLVSAESWFDLALT